MISTLVSLLLVATPAIPVQQWVCVRTDSTGVEDGRASGLLTLRPDTLAVSFKIGRTLATGQARVDDASIRGRMANEAGMTFGFRLDRVTGEFALLREAQTGGGVGASEYFGRCTSTRHSLTP